MKKWLAVLLTLCLLLSLAACAEKTPAPEKTKPQAPAVPDETKPETPSAPEEEEPEEEEPDEEEPEEEEPEDSDILRDPYIDPFGFRRDAVIEETVLVDESGVRITATGLNYTPFAVEIALHFENNSGNEVHFACGAPYPVNSINGLMTAGDFLISCLEPGEAADETLAFRYRALGKLGINALGSIELGFKITDSEDL